MKEPTKKPIKNRKKIVSTNKDGTKRKPRTKKQIDAQFKPGNCANPHGRPVIPAEMKQRIVDLTPEAIDFLESIVTNNRANKSLRMTAAKQLLDRGLGRPKQEIELSGSVDIPIVLDSLLDKELNGNKTPR